MILPPLVFPAKSHHVVYIAAAVGYGELKETVMMMHHREFESKTSLTSAYLAHRGPLL